MKFSSKLLVIFFSVTAFSFLNAVEDLIAKINETGKVTNDPLYIEWQAEEGTLGESEKIIEHKLTCEQDKNLCHYYKIIKTFCCSGEIGGCYFPDIDKRFAEFKDQEAAELKKALSEKLQQEINKGMKLTGVISADELFKNYPKKK